jgi:uncharacterized protein (TIGR03437 family)
VPHTLFPTLSRISGRALATVGALVLLLALGSAAPARAAVTSIVVSPSGVNLIHGQSQQFAAVVTVTSGSSTAVFWSISPTIGAMSTTGLYTAPASVFQTYTITVTATSQADPTKTATATITLTPTVQITAVTPANASIGEGETLQFTATVTGTTNTAVTWSINPQLGGITTDGLYTAPVSITASNRITVTAISVADPGVSRSVTLTLNPSAAAGISISPSSVSLGPGGSQQFTATVTNSDQLGVRWSMTPAVGTLTDTGLYTAPSVVSGTQTVKITATALADPTRSASATVTLGNILDVGSGAPNDAVANLFRSNFYRGRFDLLVTLPPASTVKRLGTTGLVQEFTDALRSSVKRALIMPNSNILAPTDDSSLSVYQMDGDLYAYYTSVGSATAGYPKMDSSPCPTVLTTNACSWALFDKNYALFAYRNALIGGSSFTVRNNFYTRWYAMGATNGPGPAIEPETAVTLSSGSAATVQTYLNGMVVQYTNGSNTGKYYGISQPLYDLYLTNGTYTGRLGFPTSDEVTLATGVHRQTFQGGALEYTPGSDTGPSLRLPVTGIALVADRTTTGTINLNLGDTFTVTAKVSGDGVELSGRVVSWSTSNSKVVTVTAAAEIAVIKAVGGGTAIVTATSEGVTSPRMTIVVTAPCCQVGEGAPTLVQQAFQDALSRYRLSVVLPAQSSATRVGNGYVQTLQSSDPANPVSFLVTKSDRSGTAYLISGALLKAYQDLGGPGGTLGYPSSDASAGGRQVFENGAALAGSPIRLVSGVVHTKWAQLGYETGSAGSPTSDPAAFATFGANSGQAQGFTGGTIYAATNGPRVGQAYLVSGLILARYSALGGPGGVFGMPASDEFVTGNTHQQNFEGGSIDFNNGDTAAKEHSAARTPAVLVSPSTAVAGSRVRVAVIGFPASSPIQVSITGQSNFQINNSTGAYSWELYLPLTTTSRTIDVRAADTRSTASASATITVKGLAENRVLITKVSGDNQTGMPGAFLSRTLKIALKDSAGGSVAGAVVTFQASPGAKVSAATVSTDQNGEAEVTLRLPAAEGIALVTVDSPNVASSPVTFGARAVASGLSSFPKLMATGTAAVGNGTASIADKGALLASVASMLRYLQNAGTASAPNGTADPSALNDFLKRSCTAAGAQSCDGFLANPDGGDQVVNLWRAADFTGGLDVVVGKPDLATVADWIAEGSPVLLSLAMTASEVAAGGHFVVATGIASDGGIVIHDPVQASRTSLADMRTGVSVNNVMWRAELRSIARFVARQPVSTRFLAAAVSQTAETAAALALDVQSSAGPCGVPLELGDAAPIGGGAAGAGRISRFVACDGALSVYQLTAGAARPYRASVADLAAGGLVIDISGSAAAVYQVARRSGALTVSPLKVSFEAASVVNAATFTPGLAPGSLMAIFGSGLAGSKGNTTVELDGKAVRVVAVTAFQINAEVPTATAPGVHTLTVRSDLGSMTQSVEIRDVAPAIFVLATGRGAVVNQNGSLNGPNAPLARGQVLLVYATGLGAVRVSGQLSLATAAVTANLNGANLPVSFAGLAPGFIGLYQVNVPVPAATLPGLDLPLAIRAGNAVSTPVNVSIQ